MLSTFILSNRCHHIIIYSCTISFCKETPARRIQIFYWTKRSSHHVKIMYSVGAIYVYCWHVIGFTGLNLKVLVRKWLPRHVQAGGRGVITKTESQHTATNRVCSSLNATDCYCN